MVPTLQSEWRITAAAAAWLTASVQVGIVVGAVTSVLLTLANRCRPHVLLAWCTAGAACSTVVLAVVVYSLVPVILLRFFTGIFLTGVYPVGMKLMATISEPSTRGKAFGLLLGALTLGPAKPHLLGGIGNLRWRYVMGAAAAIALTGALIAAIGIRPGPYSEKRPDQPNARYSLTMFREHAPRLINIGYLGHMCELDALWTWLPTYVVASQKSGNSGLGSQFRLELFIVVGIAGVAGCLLGGWASDRWGRSRTAVVALAVSGSCCLRSPIMFLGGWIPLFIFLLVWGAAVIADSGVFSTALSETADARYVGTALTAQTAFGFLLTVVTIQIVPILAGIVGWQFAFPALFSERWQCEPLNEPKITITGGTTMTSARSRTLPQVGQTAELSRTITENDISLFTGISGDRNPLHYDLKAARASRFGEIVVQGGITSAILNAVVAEELPRPGTVFLSVNWEFKAPVRPGDVIT